MANSKKVLGLTLIVLIAITGVTVYLLWPKPDQLYIRQENLGGPYNVVFKVTGSDLNGYDEGVVVYTENGVQHIGYYDEYFNSSLTWINNNVADNSVFLNWFEYGQMINALTDCKSMSQNPSEQALMIFNDEYAAQFTEFDANQKIMDVAATFATTNETAAMLMMEKYGARYLLLPVSDGGAGKAYWFFTFSALDASQYIDVNSDTPLVFSGSDYTDLGKETMLYRFETNTDLTHFKQVYSDANVMIYKIVY
jgi:hypothetical protein